MSRALPIVVYALLSAVGTWGAGVEWEKIEISAQPAEGANDLTVEFRFCNRSDHVLAIESVTPGCDCTTAVSTKTIYLPGEPGTIPLTFHFGQRTGLQKKTVSVKFRGDPKPTILTLTTALPAFIKLQPGLLYWRVGAPPERKSVLVTPTEKQSLRIEKAQAESPDFSIEVEPVTAGQAYRVWVTPRSTEVMRLTVINMDCLLDGKLRKSTSIYATIKPVGPGAEP